MRLLLITLYIIFGQSTTIFSQETAKPLSDQEIVRKLSKIDIEGKEYETVKVTLKSISPDFFFSYDERVKVLIVDNEGKEIWKKTLKNVYLYVFSDGQIQVGKPNFNKILITKNSLGLFNGKIRESEGVY